MEQLTKQLQESDTTILDLKAEVSKLKANLESLKFENTELKSKLSQSKVPEPTSINGDSEFSSLQSILTVSEQWCKMCSKHFFI